MPIKFICTSKEELIFKAHTYTDTLFYESQISIINGNIVLDYSIDVMLMPEDDRYLKFNGHCFLCEVKKFKKNFSELADFRDERIEEIFKE